jgi:hypothetical protein
MAHVYVPWWSTAPAARPTGHSWCSISVFSHKCFVFDKRTPKTNFLIPINSPPVKTNTKRTGTWRRTQITPVLSSQLGFYAEQIGRLSKTFRDNLPMPSSKINLSIASAVKMGPTGCPETSLKNCPSSLRKINYERRSHLDRGGRLKSRVLQYYQQPDKKKRDISRDSNVEVPTRCTCYRVYFIWRLLYMFRVSLSPIFRSTKQL